MGDAVDNAEQEPPPKPEAQERAPPETTAPPPAPQPEPPQPANRSWLPAAWDWRIVAAIGVAIAIAIAAVVYLNQRQGEPLLPEQAPATVAQEEEWPGLSEHDRLGVRPVSMPRPVMTAAMQSAMLSGYADLEFTVGADGKAADIRVIRESVEDYGYAREARRLVAAATWPTEWRGRAAPYPGRFRVIFPPGRNAGRIAPLTISSPNLTSEILALRRNVSVTLIVRVAEDGSVVSADILDAEVQNDAVLAEAMRVAMSARYPQNPAGFGYETQLVVNFDVMGALGNGSDTPAGPVVSLSEVPFAQRPSASDFSRNYPRRALNAGLSGRVTLACVVQRSLRLECSIVEEDPPGHGFGQAGLRIARRFRAERQFPDGRTTVGAQVTVPMVFRAE